MAQLTADELRALTPQPRRVTDLCGQLASGMANVDVVLARVVVQTLNLGIAIAGHLDRIASAMEAEQAEDREYRARVTERVANGAVERQAAATEGR